MVDARCAKTTVGRRSKIPRGMRVTAFACGAFAPLLRQQLGVLLMYRRNSMSSAATLVVALGSPQIAGAQQQYLEEIVVTAQKREQSINDVGITVNAFTAEQLSNYGVKSAEDLETITPGLTVTDAQPAGVPVFTIRGVGFADFTTSSSSTVGLYFDEVNIPYSVMSRGVLFDVARVEVLKGPQGDLYGRNTTAGQINFVSRKPTSEFAGGMTVDYSRFSVFDLETFVSGPLNDSMQGRVAVKYIKSNEGWQESITRPGDTLGKRDEVAARGLLNFQIGDAASLLLNAHYFRDHSENMAGTAFDGTTIGNPSPVFLGGAGPINFSTGDNRAADWAPDFRPKRNNTLQGASAKLEWAVADGLNLSSITAYDEFRRDPENWNTSGVAFHDANTSNTTRLDVFSQEVRLSSDSDTGFYWLAGVFYSDDDVSEDYFFDMSESFFATALGINEIDTRYEQSTESVAGFAHVEWKFADKFRLTLGARYTEEDREWSGCTYDSGDGTLAAAWNFILTPFLIVPSGLPDPGALSAGGCGIYNDVPGSRGFGQFGVFNAPISTEKWMWKGTLDYAPTDDVLFYGTVSTGFKSGGFNGAAAQTHSQLLPIRPEDLTAYELGLKSTLFDRSLQLNAAVFFYDYEDKQEPSVAVTPVGNIVGLSNVPKSEVRGAEIEAHWLATGQLTIDLGVAWLKTEIVEYQAIDTVASVFPNVVTFDASGAELANSPRWQTNGTFTYRWPLAGGRGLFIGGDISYKADNEGAVQDPISSYTLVNTRIGFTGADDRWAVTLWGRNVLDKDYWLASSTSNCCYVRLNGMPRTYGVTLSYNFD